MLLPINENDRKVLIGALKVYVSELRLLERTAVSPYWKDNFRDDISAANTLVDELERISKPTVFEMDQNVKDFLKLEKKIQAIKYVREVTGKGLKESKDYVDAIQAKMVEDKKAAEEADKAADKAARENPTYWSEYDYEHPEDEEPR